MTVASPSSSSRSPERPLTASSHSRKLTESLHSLSPLSRRASMDFRYGRSPTPSSPGPDSPRRIISRSPSTPAIKKRASISSLSSLSGASSPVPGRLIRKSSLLSMRSTPEPIMENEPLRRRELPPQDMSAPTAVVFHDSSYKHRYSRPGTSRADLATIVERPERIPAATLGVAAAQTRVGRNKLSIRKSVRRGTLADPEVMLVHSHAALVKGGKSPWPEELAAMCDATADKLRIGECEVPKSFHQGDLYLCSETREDLEGCLGALYDGVDLVFGENLRNGTISEDGEESAGVRRAFVCIRPPGHHCAEAQPSGFCWLNNVHIAIAHAARHHGLSHAVILDFDLHHGDGSQSITWTLNELAASPHNAPKRTSGISVPFIGYFSLHDINSYPCEYGDVDKIKNASLNLDAHGQCIHNVHLAPYASVDEFWDLYEQRYSVIFSKAREFLAASAAASTASKQKKGREFKAGVFLSAGFDASEHESPGMQRHKVNVPTSFFARFTSDAVALANTYCSGRVVSVLEGGYSDRALTTGVFAHVAGLSCPTPEASTYVPPSLGLTDQQPVPTSLQCSPVAVAATTAERGWDPSWWDQERISELEKHLYKMTAKKPPVEKSSTSYLSPTAASVAKKNDTPRRVSSNGYLDASPGPPPPPPVVPWEVAAFQTSRMIIPEYKESTEIPPLEKPAKRHSVIGVVTEHQDGGAGGRMTLRDRKPKPPPEPSVDLDRGRRRRTTMGAIPDSRATSRVPPISRAPSRALSRAPSRATTPAIPQSRGPTPAPSLQRRTQPAGTTTATTGATVAGPRITRKPSTTTLRKPHHQPTMSTASTSTTASSLSPLSLPPTRKPDDGTNGLVERMQRITLTYRNRSRDREREERSGKVADNAASPVEDGAKKVGEMGNATNGTGGGGNGNGRDIEGIRFGDPWVG